jgi:hypothetical protein
VQKYLSSLVIVLTIPLHSAMAQSVGCLAAHLSPWFWLTEAHIWALQSAGVVKDAPACHAAVDAGGDLAKQIAGDNVVSDAAKGISSCACDAIFQDGDPRLHLLDAYPGPTTGNPPQPVQAVPFGEAHLVLTKLGNECWNYDAAGKKDELHVILANNGTCPHLGQQEVAFQKAGAGPWYQLKVGGDGCVNVDESQWNSSDGQNVIHLTPCSNGAHPNDMWAILLVKPAAGQPGVGNLVFISKRSAGCLDLRSQDWDKGGNDRKTARVQQNFCNWSNNQLWSLR